MIYRTPQQQRHRWLVLYQLGAAMIIAFVLVSLFDFVLLNALTTVDATTGRVDRSFESDDWYTLLRNMGFVGTWAVLALAMALHDRGWSRALLVFLSPLLAGAAAELLKLVFVRERPVSDSIIQPGGYHFRFPFSGFFDGHNLGLPSSHTAVAFGGACLLGAMLPRLRPLLILLALGCGYSRMISGAHFASDVFMGAVVGYAIARWIAGSLPHPDRKYTL